MSGTIGEELEEKLGSAREKVPNSAEKGEDGVGRGITRNAVIKRGLPYCETFSFGGYLDSNHKSCLAYEGREDEEGHNSGRVARRRLEG